MLSWLPHAPSNRHKQGNLNKSNSQVCGCPKLFFSLVLPTFASQALLPTAPSQPLRIVPSAIVVTSVSCKYLLEDPMTPPFPLSSLGQKRLPSAPSCLPAQSGSNIPRHFLTGGDSGNYLLSIFRRDLFTKQPPPQTLVYGSVVPTL